jgi:glycosyltransferase involved in cell wall biosynthesis
MGSAGPPRTILFVEDSPAASYGGSKRVLVEVVPRLDRAAWRPRVAFRTDGPYRADLEAAGIPTLVYGRVAPRGRQVPRPAWTRWLGLDVAPDGAALRGPPRRWLWNALATWRWLGRDRLAARRLCAALPGDVALIHFNSRMATGCEWAHVARRLGAALVIHDHEVWREPPATYRRVARRAACLVCLTAERAATLRGFCGEPLRTAVVPNGIDLDALDARRRPERAAGLRAELGGRPLLITAAHYQPWKGQLQALEAAARLAATGRPFAWRFCGHPTDPVHFEAVRARAAAPDLRDHVVVDGYRDDVPALLEAADVAVHTSIAAEPFSLSVLEAMALGVPVVAAREGGHTEVVREGVEGLLYTPRDPAALAETLAALLADPARRARLGAAARERVRDGYTIAAQVASLEAVYRAAVDVPRR